MKRVLSILVLSILLTLAFGSCTPEAISTANDEYQTEKGEIDSIGDPSNDPDEDDYY